MAISSRLKSGRIFFLKIDLPAFLAFALFAGLIFFYLIPGFEKAMMERKRNLIHEITASAYSLLDYYHSLEKQGIIDGDKAKEEARSAISKIRYGDELKDYFWITDRHPRMIVHPYRPELNGTDLTGYLDSRGKAIFVEFVDAVALTGENYVEYMWQWNDDSTRVVPKLSYVRLFEPWGWIIGTGIYIEDVRSEIRKMEFRALAISGLIGLLIVILLAAVSRQSHKIEKKRSLAEAELHKSRELYKTLAEAASEGVLVLSSGGIQANKTLLSWLDYNDEDLADLKIQDILVTPLLPGLEDLDTLYEELAARRYSECTMKLKDGSLMMSHADFSRILLGGSKAVLVVIRPAGSIKTLPGFSPHITLTDGISTGFFKISYGRKNRFIFATGPVLKMLGFDDIKDLMPYTLGSFFAEPAQLKTFRRALEKKERISNREVLLKSADGIEFWALINLMVVESNLPEIWCEGTIELLTTRIMKNNRPVVNLAGYSASFIMEMPVFSIMQEPVFCKTRQTVEEVTALMKTNGTEYAIVTDEKGDPAGIASAAAIGIRLGEGASSGEEIEKLMSSPPGYIDSCTTVNEAFNILSKGRAGSLLVTSGEDQNRKVIGIISLDQLADSFFTSPGILFREIDQAHSSEMLKEIFLKARKLTASMIMGHSDPDSTVQFISAVADRICSRILALCLEAAGTPPCRFAFIQTGSAGRMEQTLSTDQDNGIIYEDCEGEELKRAHEYFVSLGKRINDMLAAAGYRYCPGKKMAGNPLWCQPLSRWKKYFSDWITMPGPEEILEISIFFDFRYCYGDPVLVDELREYISKGLHTSDIYFHHMAAAWKRFAPLTNIRTDKATDIKKLIMPLTGIVRLYSLRSGINASTTIERIIGLYSLESLDSILLRDLIRAWKDLTFLRLTHQVSCIEKGVEPDNIVDLHLFDSEITGSVERAALTISELLLKAGNDFYTSTI